MERLPCTPYSRASHRVRAFLFVAMSATITACGGGGQAPAPFSALPPTASSPTLPVASASQPASTLTAIQPAPIALPSGVIATQGTISSLRTGGFLLDQGAPAGKIPVVVPSTATTMGGTAAAGLLAQVVGSGSIHTGMTAIVVSLSSTAPAAISVQGTITRATASGFSLNVDSTHTAVPIVLTSAVIVGGGTLEVGATAKVTGTGSLASAIVPVQIVVTDPTPTPGPNQVATPTPGPIAQTHILTADYLGTPFGTTSIAWSSAAPHLTWAQTGTTSANAIAATGIKTMFYTNPNRVQTGDGLNTSDETTFAHTCTGSRITDVFDGITQNVMNVESPSMQKLYATYIASKTSGAHFDAVFEDDAGALSAFNAINPFSQGMPCNYTDSAWLSGDAAMENAAPHPVITNGLSALNGHNPSLSLALTSTTNVVAMSFEHCYSDNSQAEMNGWLWQAIENSELSVVNAHKSFECQARNLATASTSVSARIYTLASFLLTYDPASSILWDEFATPSGFHVLPESRLVALAPIVPEPTSIAALAKSGGAYGREYARCYVAGAFVGPCAVAVNPNSGLSTPFPYPQYGHSLALSGSGVLDGGTMSIAGAAPPVFMPALSAYVVFQ